MRTVDLMLIRGVLAIVWIATGGAIARYLSSAREPWSAREGRVAR